MKKAVCYCGSQKTYEDCCSSFLAGETMPKTPEQLMRSRYCAFCTKNIEYLIATHHPSKHHPNERDALEKTVSQTQWLALKIVKTKNDPANPNVGYVEFAAFYKRTPVGQLHENSSFIYENNQWYYLDGEILEPLKFGRNEPCWCGSNKKHKKCHGR